MLNVFACKVLFPLRYAQKQYIREQAAGEKYERPYIFKPSTSSGPLVPDSKTVAAVRYCDLFCSVLY